MASSQKMAGLVTKMSQMRAVGASEAKWVPAQVMVSKEPRWVPAEVIVPRDSLQQPDATTAMVDPLPKERWNSTAASCSSNTIGPLCSDVIEKNWDSCNAPSAGYDQIGNQNPGHWEDQHFENVTLQVIRHLSPGHFYGQYWKTSEWYCTAESIIWDARLYTEMGRLTISTEMVLDFSICTFQNLLYCVQEIEHDWHF